MMDHPSAVRACCVATCGQPSRGHFCNDCWTALPWNIKGAIGRAKKVGRSTLDAVKAAKQFLEDQRGVKPKEPKCSTD